MSDSILQVEIEKRKKVEQERDEWKNWSAALKKHSEKDWAETVALRKKIRKTHKEIEQLIEEVTLNAVFGNAKIRSAIKKRLRKVLQNLG